MLNVILDLFLIILALAWIYAMLSLWVEWREHYELRCRELDADDEWDSPSSISAIDGDDPMDRPGD